MRQSSRNFTRLGSFELSWVDPGVGNKAVNFFFEVLATRQITLDEDRCESISDRIESTIFTGLDSSEKGVSVGKFCVRNSKKAMQTSSG